MTWDTSVPAGTDQIKDGDNVIREFKTDIQTALQAEGAFPVSTSSPVYRPRGGSGNTASRPAATDGGIYFNTQTGDIQRSNGSAWSNVGVNFASGTKMLFYQASAPIGWTRDTGVNDKFIRVVSAGSPGTTGGTLAASTNIGAHTHSISSHSHNLSSNGWARIRAGVDTGADDLSVTVDHVSATSWSGTEYSVNGDSSSSSGSSGNTSGAELDGTTDSGGSGTSGASSVGSGSYAYADVMIATKD